MPMPIEPHPIKPHPIKPHSYLDVHGPLTAHKGYKGTSFIEGFALKRMFKAKASWVARDDVPAEKPLLDMVREMSKKMGVEKPPRVIIYDSAYPNAASIGGKKLVFSSDLLAIMPPEDVKAIIGHELSHHRHHTRDRSILGAMSAAVFGAYFLLHYKMRAHPKVEIMETYGLTASIVADVTFSTPYRRHMETEADKEGAYYTGRPDAMADSLKVLDERAQELKKAKRENPKGRKILKWMYSLEDGISRTFDSHPPVEQRIARLKEMQLGAADAERQIASSALTR